MELPNGSLTRVILVTTPVLLLTYFWFSRRNPKYPPCPLRPWPIVGNLLQLDRDPREQFARFRKQSGDIYSLYMGQTHVVVLNGLDVLKEAFVKQGDHFSDRATIFLDYVSDGVNRGVVPSSGAVWKEHRLFCTSMLKRIDSERNALADKIQDEVTHFVSQLESFNGEPRNVHILTKISVSSIIYSIVVGHRFNHDDADFKRMHELLEFNVLKLTENAILNYFPWLQFLPGDRFSCKIIEKNYREFYDIFVNLHMTENEDVVGEAGNYIAGYLQEMNNKLISGEVTTMNRPSLLRLILDMFVAGTETTATTLMWMFLYMVNYPDVQEKISEEIKAEVGQNRDVVIHNRSKLVYLSATIMEIQRLVSILPLSFPRVVKGDVCLQGYTIPKGAEILMNFDTVLLDPSLWGDDVDVFKPERFIAEDGSLTSPEAWVPFSVGRRACLGERMANMELFLFFSNIIQKFKLLPADPKQIPPIKGSFGISHTPLPFEVKFVPRN
jgi:cytochrome P450